MTLENRDRRKIRRQLKYAATLEPTKRIAYWQRLGSDAIFAAAFELMSQRCEATGADMRLDKRFGHYHRGKIRYKG
jgi:hypothetical protein